MDYKYNKNLVRNARYLRNNMTPEEKRLWYDFLRKYPKKFLRQKPLGNYIADFYCAEAKLVIELDGSQHFEEAGMKYDEDRTKYIEQYGLTVLRIPNNEIRTNLNGVCEYIDAEVKRVCGDGTPSVTAETP